MDKTILNSTYTYVGATNGKITFANVNDVSALLSFGVSQTQASSKGSAGNVTIRRNALKISVPFKAAGSDCEEGCKTIDVAKAASFEISAPTVADAQDVIDEVVRVLKHPDAAKWLLGFKPNPAATFAPVP